MPKGKFVLINGVNYTIYIIAAAGLVLFGGLQYTICRRPTKKSHRQAMLFVPFLILCAALFVFGAEGGGSFLDMRRCGACTDRLRFSVTCRNQRRLAGSRSKK